MTRKFDPSERARVTDGEPRQRWEPPSLRYVGTIAELVQTPKQSGSQDCGGRKRQGTGNDCGNG